MESGISRAATSRAVSSPHPAAMEDLASTSSARLSPEVLVPTVSAISDAVVFTTGAAPVDGEPPMTKSRMKKLAKQERLKARNVERKTRAKEKRADLKAKRAAGELPADALPPRKKRKVGPPGKPTPFNARIVIDLGFDDLMNQKVYVIRSTLCLSSY